MLVSIFPFLLDRFGFSTWIIGDDVIIAAQKRAALRQFSVFKLLDVNFNISWFLFQDDLNNLSQFVFNLAENNPLPDFIILHCGSELIGKIKTISLISLLKQELFKIHHFLYNSCLIFSEFLPFLLWTRDSLLFREKIRKRLNRCMSKFLPSIDGISFRHVNLEDLLPGFYESDEFTLSDIGLDFLNLDFLSMLEFGLQRLGGPRR